MGIQEDFKRKDPDFELVNYGLTIKASMILIQVIFIREFFHSLAPYNWQEERERYPKANGNETAAFYFTYSSPMGGLDAHYINLDPAWEWSMVFFPARMYHGVNPFYTSDEKRISISGNIYVVDKSLP